MIQTYVFSKGHANAVYVKAHDTQAEAEALEQFILNAKDSKREFISFNDETPEGVKVKTTLFLDEVFLIQTVEKVV